MLKTSPVKTERPWGAGVVSRGLIPDSGELGFLFQKFLQYWAHHPADCLGEAPLEPLEGAVELSVRWKGSVGGTLVIRCQPEFLNQLMENRGAQTLPGGSPQEVFHEIATLYCLYLIQDLWLSEIFVLGPVLARPSGPKDWPTRGPDSTCRLLSGGNFLEIRLWMDPA